MLPLGIGALRRDGAGTSTATQHVPDNGREKMENARLEAPEATHQGFELRLVCPLNLLGEEAFDTLKAPLPRERSQPYIHRPAGDCHVHRNRRARSPHPHGRVARPRARTRASGRTRGRCRSEDRRADHARSTNRREAERPGEAAAETARRSDTLIQASTRARGRHRRAPATRPSARTARCHRPASSGSTSGADERTSPSPPRSHSSSSAIFTEDSTPRSSTARPTLISASTRSV